jgi:hypothetical protein
MEETLHFADLMSDEKILQVPQEDVLERFYSKKLYFSYSALNKLLFSPVQYYNYYILLDKEERLDKHLVEGKVIHCLLLDKASFSKQFMVSPGNIPTGNTKLVVDKVFKLYLDELRRCDTNGEIPQWSLKDFSASIIEILQEINLHQALKDDKPNKAGEIEKTGDQKRLEKILTDESISYFEYLKRSNGRNVIDQDTLTFCEAAASLIENNPKLRTMMGMDVTDFDNKEVINESYFQAEVENYPFGIKGFIDNLVIDHDNKVIRINDLKTSGKSLADFKESVDYWNYWLQAIIYVTLVAEKYADLLLEQDYSMEFNFIVIDRNRQVYAFPVSDDTMRAWLKKYHEVMEVAAYHYNERKYNLPYEFCKELVVL